MKWMLFACNVWNYFFIFFFFFFVPINIKRDVFISCVSFRYSCECVCAGWFFLSCFGFEQMQSPSFSIHFDRRDWGAFGIIKFMINRKRLTTVFFPSSFHAVVAHSRMTYYFIAKQESKHFECLWQMCAFSMKCQCKNHKKEQNSGEENKRMCRMCE